MRLKNAHIFIFFLITSPAARAETRLTVLNVQYGQAIYLSHGSRNYLFDTGDRQSLSKTLTHLVENGAIHLDAVFLTHLHPDHAGALLSLVQQIPTDIVYWNGLLPVDDPINEDITKAKSISDFQILESGSSVSLGNDLLVTILKSTSTGGNLNDTGLVFGLSLGKNKILIPGDIGEKRQEEVVQLNASWFHGVKLMVWPHHGDTLSTNFSAALGRVDFCVLSIGPNPWGLPKNSYKEQSQRTCSTTFRTDTSGDIAFEVSPRKIRVLDKP